MLLNLQHWQHLIASREISDIADNHVCRLCNIHAQTTAHSLD